MSEIGEVECGRPVRRRTGGGPCVLEAGHRFPFCQDARAVAAREKLTGVPEQAHLMRIVLNWFGLNVGVARAEDYAFRYMWSHR